MGAKFALPKQKGEDGSDDSHDGKNLQHGLISGGVGSRGSGDVVGLAKAPVHPGHAHVLDHRHEAERGAEGAAGDDVGDRGPDDGRDEGCPLPR